MQFDSFASFLDMGGYGFYVWLSFGASAALILLLIFSTLLSHKNARANIARQVKREQRLQQAQAQAEAEAQASVSESTSQ